MAWKLVWHTSKCSWSCDALMGINKLSTAIITRGFLSPIKAQGLLENLLKIVYYFFFRNKNQAILVKTFWTIHKRLMVFTGSAWLVNLWPLSIFYLFIYFLRRLLMESQIEKEQTGQHEMKISTESWCCTWLLQMKNLEKYLSLNYQKRRGCLQGGMFTLASGLNQLGGKR